MPPWIGYFASGGSPALKIRVSGPFSDPIEYEAVLDTGFTGFLSLPLVEAIRLGLILHGTTKVSYADASENYRLTARGQVEIEDHEKIGVIILEPSTNELLLGMDFSRLFQRALLVSKDGVALVEEEELAKATEAAGTAEATKANPLPFPEPPPADTPNTGS